ncbi:hypothetical protein GCM10010276_12760 [Streptomyces longisporus]|uniref:Uncharacterized protein n=1 Tax=Streptomyces longisporus TaxID=1948 RepID=A0ABP5YAL1_STRLO
MCGDHRDGETPTGFTFHEGGLDAMTRALVDLFGELGMDTNVLPRFDHDEDGEDQDD